MSDSRRVTLKIATSPSVSTRPPPLLLPPAKTPEVFLSYSRFFKVQRPISSCRSRQYRSGCYNPFCILSFSPCPGMRKSSLPHASASQ